MIQDTFYHLGTYRSFKRKGPLCQFLNSSFNKKFVSAPLVFAKYKSNKYNSLLSTSELLIIVFQYTKMLNLPAKRSIFAPSVDL